jgi:hypothetical protein
MGEMFCNDRVGQRSQRRVFRRNVLKDALIEVRRKGLVSVFRAPHPLWALPRVGLGLLRRFSRGIGAGQARGSELIAPT